MFVGDRLMYRLGPGLRVLQEQLHGLRVDMVPIQRQDLRQPVSISRRTATIAAGDTGVNKFDDIPGRLQQASSRDRAYRAAQLVIDRSFSFTAQTGYQFDHIHVKTGYAQERPWIGGRYSELQEYSRRLLLSRLVGGASLTTNNVLKPAG